MNLRVDTTAHSSLPPAGCCFGVTKPDHYVKNRVDTSFSAAAMGPT